MVDDIKTMQVVVMQDVAKIKAEEARRKFWI